LQVHVEMMPPEVHVPDVQSAAEVQITPGTFLQVPDEHLVRPSVLESHWASSAQPLPGVTTHVELAQLSVAVFGQPVVAPSHAT
jgi:hypothetical protein